MQVSAWREMSYTGMPWSQVRSVGISQAACECVEFGNGNGGVHRALLGWVDEGEWKESGRNHARGA